MQTNELYQLIGQITYSFGKIDFLISNIAVDLKIVNNYPEFFAQSNFENKIKKVKDRTEEFITEINTRNTFLELLSELDKLRIKRNSIVHSIILQSGDDFLFYNFKKKGDVIAHSIKEYTSEEIKKLNEDFISLHNKLYLIWQNEIATI